MNTNKILEKRSVALYVVETEMGMMQTLFNRLNSLHDMVFHNNFKLAEIYVTLNSAGLLKTKIDLDRLEKMEMGWLDPNDNIRYFTTVKGLCLGAIVKKIGELRNDLVSLGAVSKGEDVE